MDDAPVPPADKKPTLNGDAASPPDGPAGAFDWQRFWLCMKHPLPLEVAHVRFDQPDDAENIAQLRGCVFKDRVRFENCIFPTQVDLAESRFEQSLHMVDCTFEKGLILRNVQVRTRLSLRGSTVHDEARFWLDWRGLTTGADLSLICVTANAPIDLYNARIGADLRLDGLHAKAKGTRPSQFGPRSPLGIVDQHHVRNEMVGKAVNLRGAEIGRHLYAYVIDGKSTTINGQIDLRAKVTGQVNFNDAVVDAGTRGKAVNMDAATVGGSVFFMNGTRITGTIDLRARVTGQVNFNNAVVDAGTGGTAVQMETATVGGSVFFMGGTRITGSIDLRARVTGQVNFNNAVVDAGVSGKAVNMDAATVGGSVFFRDATRITGKIDLRARVTGQVNFNNAVVDAGVGGTAVGMNRATVGGSVFFQNGTRITGTIDLRAKVTGGVLFENAVVDAGTKPVAITFESADIGGDCFLREQTLIIGSINFLEARLRGGLTCSDTFSETTFDQPGSGGNHVPRQCLCVTGGIDLRFAEVHGPVVLHGVGIGGTIKARHLTVHGDLHVCGGMVGEAAPPPQKPDDAPASGDKEHTPADDEDTKRDPHRARDSRQLAEWYRELHTAYLKALKARDAADTPSDDLTKAVEEATEAVESFLRGFWWRGAAYGGWAAWQTEATPKDKDQTAVDLELAEVHGHLWIKGTKALGTVRLDDAEVVGEANFDRSIIHGNLLMRSADVRGEVIATKASGPEPKQGVVGTLDATGSAIGTLTLDIGATDASPEQPTIVFKGATVGKFEVRGAVLAKDGSPIFDAHRLSFKDLDLDGFKSASARKLSGRDWARIGLFLVLAFTPVALLACAGRPPGAFIVVVGMIVLVCAAILNSWRRVVGEDGAQPRRSIMDFLECSQFSAALYVVCERWARASGDETLADEIFLGRRQRELIMRRDRMTALAPARKKRRIWHDRDFHWAWHRCVLDFVFGYGVRPRRAVHLFVLLWLINWAVFLPAYSVERPLSFEASANETYSAAKVEAELRRGQLTEADLPNLWTGEGGKPGQDDKWGAQMAFFMALRLQIPLVDLFVDKPWKPADRAMFADGTKRGGWNLTYENYAAAMRALNLILVPVIIAGATGFLKPKDRGENGT